MYDSALQWASWAITRRIERWRHLRRSFSDSSRLSAHPAACICNQSLSQLACLPVFVLWFRVLYKQLASLRLVRVIFNYQWVSESGDRPSADTLSPVFYPVYFFFHFLFTFHSTINNHTHARNMSKNKLHHRIDNGIVEVKSKVRQ